MDDHDASLRTPPSSPPLGALSDTTTTKIPTKLSSPQSPKLPRRRKRPRVSDGTRDQGYVSASSSNNGDVSNSSDAPFFSSDDLADADATKYASPARKKQYRRAWYEPESAERSVSHRLMRTMTRPPKDSGIYMNSDSSNSSLSEGFELETAALKTQAVQAQSRKMQAFMQTDESDHSLASPSLQTRPLDSGPKSRDEQVVERHIEYALDQSKEEIDLSGLQLSHLPPECFSALQSFVKQPVFQPNAFTDAACSPLTPALKIFLANNQLAKIPPSLFDLQYLTVLSLRRNSITELPTSIGRLKNLRQLNLDSNPLHFLPWEVIHVLKRLEDRGSESNTAAEFQTDPSRMTFSALSRQVYGRLEAVEDALERKDFTPITRTTILSRTPKALMEVDGSLARGSPIMSPSHAANMGATPDELIDQLIPETVASKRPPAVRDASRVPSLFALALASCAASPTLPDISSYLPPDTSSTVLSSLAQAQQVVDLEGPGGRICSGCGRRYIIARAEWVEFATRGPAAPFALPLLRRTCSWACANDIEEREPKDLSQIRYEQFRQQQIQEEDE